MCGRKDFLDRIKKKKKNLEKIFKKGLTKREVCSIIGKYETKRANAALAQLDRVFGYEPKGRGFESLTPCHK